MVCMADYKSDFRFAGELSPESRRYLKKQQFIRGVSFGLIFSGILIACLIAAALTISPFFWAFLFIPLVLFVMVSIAPLISTENHPTQIEVMDGVIYTTTVHGNTISKDVYDVKKVIDTGDCYFILFALLPKNFSCLCQKDLLVEGTLEDFERLFEGKIKRLNKNKEGEQNTL